MDNHKKKAVCISLSEKEIQMAKICGESIGASISQVVRIALYEYVSHKPKGFLTTLNDLLGEGQKH